MKRLAPFGQPGVFPIWLAFFTYAAGMALFVQLVALPLLFPSLHAGNGLIVGGDWLLFQHLAAENAELIRQQGWSAWELRLSNQAPAGVAAAIYATSGISKPYMLIPLFAALHAGGAIVVMLLAETLGVGRRLAIVAALPFLFGPTALLWFTQIHKDTFHATGLLLILYGWIYLLRNDAVAGGSRLFQRLILFCGLMLAGTALIWLVRPYYLEILSKFAILLSLFGGVLFILRARKKVVPWHYAVVMSIALVFSALALSSFKSNRATTPTTPEIKKMPEPWQSSAIFPDYVDRQFARLYGYRLHFQLYNPVAGSAIDNNVSLNSVEKMLRYLPRNFQVGTFSPFPSMWFAEGANAATTMMRKIIGLEMSLVYLALFGLVPAAYFWGRKVEFWIMAGFFLYIVTIVVYAIPNVGTMMRYRYGPYMVLVGIGLIALVKLARSRRVVAEPGQAV